MAASALVEPISCLSHGLDLTNPIPIGQRILVAGAGIIGLLWSSALHHLGHRKTVTISEVQKERRELAKKLDLDYTIKEPSQLVKNVDVFDFAVDCSGNPRAISDAISHLGKSFELYSSNENDDFEKIFIHRCRRQNVHLWSIQARRWGSNQTVWRKYLLGTSNDY